MAAATVIAALPVVTVMVLRLAAPSRPPPLFLAQKYRQHAAWTVLFAACLCSDATYSGHTFGWSFLLRGVQSELELTTTHLSLLWASGILTTAPLLLLVGQMIECFGQLRVASIVSPLWVLVVGLASHASDPLQLGLAIFAMRLLGPGVLCMCAQACIGHWFDARRGLASVIFTCANWLMIMVQPLVARLVEAIGWRHALRTLSLVYAGMLLPAMAFLRDQPESYGLAPDGGLRTSRRTRAGHAELTAEDVTQHADLAAPEEVDAMADAMSMRDSAGAASAAATVGLSRGQAVRTRAFWAVVLCHASIEFLWCGSQLFLVELLGARGLAPTQVGTAQVVGSAAAVVATVSAGLCVDRIERPHDKRLVLVGATALGAAAALALISCNSLTVACMATGLLGTMMGPLDVLFASLYASLFGRAHLGSILGLVQGLTYVAIGSSPVVFGAARDRLGSFTPVLAPLVMWMPIVALALAAAPPVLVPPKS